MDNSPPSKESQQGRQPQAEAEEAEAELEHYPSPYRHTEYSATNDEYDDLDLSSSVKRGSIAIDRQESGFGTGFGHGGHGVYIPGGDYDPFSVALNEKKFGVSSVDKIGASLSDMLLMTTSSTSLDSATASSPPQKYSLEPIPPYYEEYTSFTCDMDSALSETEMVDRVFDAVQGGLDSEDLANISGYKLKKNKNSIRGICYKNNTSAHWKMKVYKGRTNTTEGITQLMVEFQRRMGCTISFHWFYNTLGQQKTILELRKMKLEDAPTPNEGFMQPLPPPPMDFGDEGDGEAPAPLSAEEQHLEDLKHMDEGAVKALHAWASSEMVDQRLEGLRVVVTLTEAISTQDALVEKKMPLIKLLFDGLRCNDDEIQRLSSIALAQCAANPKLQDALSREFGKVVEILKHLGSSLASPNYPLEAVDTQRHLKYCVKSLLDSENSARMDPYKDDLSKLRLLTV